MGINDIISTTYNDKRVILLQYQRAELICNFLRFLQVLILTYLAYDKS